jgi:hypothetical protein
MFCCLIDSDLLLLLPMIDLLQQFEDCVEGIAITKKKNINK